MFGTQMLFEELLRSMGITPEQAKAAFERIQKEVPAAADRFGRMEQNQDAIMQALAAIGPVIQALAATQAQLLRTDAEFKAFRALVTDYILRQRKLEPFRAPNELSGFSDVPNGHDSSGAD